MSRRRRRADQRALVELQLYAVAVRVADVQGGPLAPGPRYAVEPLFDLDASVLQVRCEFVPLGALDDERQVVVAPGGGAFVRGIGGEVQDEPLRCPERYELPL